MTLILPFERVLNQKQNNEEVIYDLVDIFNYSISFLINGN